MANTSLCIFYTDDDYDDQKFFEEVILSINGDHRIYLQNNGEELLQNLRELGEQPDIIFLDLNMPKKSGIEVLEEIRATDGLQHLKIVIFSTSNNEEVIKICRELGANLYVRKPSSYSNLKKMMHSLLSMNWLQESAAGNFVFAV